MAPTNIEIEKIVGWTIYFDKPSATFTATRDDQAKVWGRNAVTLKRKDLAALRREIGKRTQGRVDLMKVGWLRPPATSITAIFDTPLTVVGLENGRLRLQTGDLGDTYWPRVVLYDPAIIAKVSEFKDRQRAANDAILAEYNAWLETLDIHPLTPIEVGALLLASKQAEEAEAAAVVQPDPDEIPFEGEAQS